MGVLGNIANFIKNWPVDLHGSITPISQRYVRTSTVGIGRAEAGVVRRGIGRDPRPSSIRRVADVMFWKIGDGACRGAACSPPGCAMLTRSRRGTGEQAG